jgi:hypothetical protein
MADCHAGIGRPRPRHPVSAAEDLRRQQAAIVTARDRRRGSPPLITTYPCRFGVAMGWFGPVDIRVRIIRFCAIVSSAVAAGPGGSGRGGSSAWLGAEVAAYRCSRACACISR